MPRQAPPRETAVGQSAGAEGAGDFPAVNTEEWGRMNRRRGELIRKKSREGLTPEEQKEYERRQQLSRAALEEAFPAPDGEEDRLEQLEARLRATAEG